LSVESLPYTLLILLAQFTAGVAALVLFAQVRGSFEAGFIRVCAYMTICAAFLTTLTALAIDATPNADAYLLDPGLLDPVRAASMALLLFSLPHVYFLRRDDEPFLANATGATVLGLGIVLLAMLASLVRLPAWSVAGPLLMLFAGALTIGATTVAMVWGHWYLVNPRPEPGVLAARGHRPAVPGPAGLHGVPVQQGALHDVGHRPAVYRCWRRAGRRGAGPGPAVRHGRPGIGTSACTLTGQTAGGGRTKLPATGFRCSSSSSGLPAR
jgi:hypothetical protein